CQHGKWHRPSTEGAAVIETDASGRRVLEIYNEHGVRHRDAKEGPAWYGFENGVEYWEYCVHGKMHRDECDGPAVVGRDEKTGAVVCEEYYRDGQMHRTDGPAQTVRDMTTGMVVHEAHFRKGRCHRDPFEGPAFMSRDLEAGTMYEQYIWRGKIHRD